LVLCFSDCRFSFKRQLQIGGAAAGTPSFSTP
jgi:hypothetical protein